MYNKKFIKRGAALLLSASMVLGLAACGGNDTESASGGSSTSEHYFKSTFLENLPDTLGDTMSGDGVIKNDTLYYGAWDKDYTNMSLYAYNLLNGESKEVWKADTSDGNNQYVNYYDVADDGTLYLNVQTSWRDTSNITEDYSDATLDDVVQYMMENFGYDSQEDAENDWNEYYAESYVDEAGNPDYQKFFNDMLGDYMSSNSILAVDSEGNKLYDIDISELVGEDGYCYNLVTDNKGNIIVGMESWTETSSGYSVAVLDADGNIKGSIALDDWINDIVVLADGTVGISTYGDDGMGLQLLDLDNMTTGDWIDTGADVSGVVDDDHVYISDGSSLYLYNIKDGTKEKYLTWVDCNILSSSVSAYAKLSDGKLAVLTRNWSSSSGQSEVEIALLEEVDKSEVPETTQINVACLYIDSDLEERVIEFNKKSTTTKISIKSYYDDSMEYDDMVNNFTTAVASDKSIDMVMFDSYSQMINYASKGLLTDLYALMEDDADVKKDDFMSGVINNCEYNGKLVALPQTFSVNTVIGKTSDVGSTPGWNLSAVKELLASKEDGTQLFYGMTRSQILNFCLCLGYKEFIDTENSTCSFDNQDFIDVLEFAAMFPEDFEWEDDVDETVLINTGKVLLSTYYLYDFNQIQMYREIFGGDVTYIGYPTGEGNGAMLSLSGLMGITENCSDKDLAWEFMRQFYLAKSDEEIQNIWNFPVRQDDFDKFCKNAMSDSNSGGSWGWGDFEVDIKPATQEDVDTVKDLINNITAVDGAITDDILSIIEEDTASYFAGQKSAEEVAQTIQSRIQIYLSETK